MSNNSTDIPSATSNKRGSGWLKFSVLAAVVVGGGLLYVLFGEYLSLDALAARETALRDFQQNHPVLVYLLAFAIYVAVTGLSLPGAAALTLVYGWYFGFLPSVILISFASTAGATVAFLFSRYLLRETIQSRFADRLQTFNEALDREGAFYLFTLRLIPAVPFFVINVVMGLTKMRVWTFWWVSQIGMFAGTLVYVYAGSTIPSLAHLADPSQLKATDVKDWEKLTRQLAKMEGADAGAAQEIWRMLPEETQTAVTNSGGKPDDDTRMAILTGLNELVTSPNLALTQPWQKSLRPPERSDDEDAAARNRRRAAEKRLTKANRAILVAAFPDTISPPQPILSKQLIAAFVVLGVFPLVVKKIMAKVQGTNRDEEEEANDDE